MKIRLLVLALLAGFLSVDSQAAGFEQFTDPLAYMNVWNTDGLGNKGSYNYGTAWGVADLTFATTDNRTFELLPNTNQYAIAVASGLTNEVTFWTDSTDGGASPGDDGNKWMEALGYFERFPLVGIETNATFSFDVEAYDLDPRYEVKGFIKVLNPSGDWGVFVQTEVVITNTGTYTLSLPLNDGFNDMTGKDLQAGWVMNGLNANPATDWGSVIVTATKLIAEDNDFDAPLPNPAQFFAPPTAISDSAISMSAVTATDTNTVEYYFTCITSDAFDSGWQSSTNYTAIGLNESTLYEFTVTARDTSSNTNKTAASSLFSATTFSSDPDAPLPNPAQFESTEASAISIKLTAVTATDVSLVEYYFDATTTNGTDSGWQSSPIYVDYGLEPGTEYTYTVTARDLSSATNTTTASDPVTLTTPSLPASVSLSDDLKGFTGNTTQNATLHDLAMAGFAVASTDAAKAVTFGSGGATFKVGPSFGNRNILRTIASDYGDADFEVYATFVMQGTTEQTAFIGVGQGLQGQYNVPDFFLLGVNAVNSEVQYGWSKVWTWIDGQEDVLTETAGISTVTNRFRMVHDTDAQTITVELDTDYAGGEFFPDRVLGTHSTTNVWQDMPQRIYISAGAGVLMKDLEIVTEYVPPVIPPADFVISAGSGSVQLTWTGVPGQTYNVEYKSALTDSTWTADATAGTDLPGQANMSATSTVSGDAVFYQIKSE